jgi:tetratricopeptide (TPR) repeat protein
MSVRWWLVTLMVLALSGVPTRAFADCKIARLGELPVTMRGLRPLVSAKINGAEALFIADSGAFYSMITPAAAAQFKLRLEPAPYWFVMTGVDALVARARLRLLGPENSAAITDLEAAGRFAAEQADIRRQIGSLYERAGLFAEAVVQYDKWIAAHDQDVQMPEARNARCWARALWGQQLDKALADCNAALKSRPDTAAFLDSRGLVRLRMGDLDKSIADYDASLKLQPRNAWSLYGRGLARVRKGLTTAGEADIAAAMSIQPRIEDETRKHGITR